MTPTAMLWMIWLLAAAEIVMVPMRRQMPEGSGLVFYVLVSIVLVWPPIAIVWIWL